MRALYMYTKNINSLFINSAHSLFINSAHSIEWALVVPWITRENLLLMFLVSLTNVTPLSTAFY
jgi:hypothetical protein